MDQRSLLYISLLFVTFLIWQTWQVDHAPKPAETPVSQSNTNDVTGSTKEIARGDLPEASEANSQRSITSSDPVNGLSSIPGKQVTVKTDVLDVVLSTVGGDVLSVKLLEYPVSLREKDTPTTLLHSDEPRYVAQSGLIHDKIGNQDLSFRAPNHYAEFAVSSDSFELKEGQDSLEVKMAWQSEDGIKVTKIYTFSRNKYDVALEYVVENLSETPWIGRQYRQLRHGPTTDSDGSRLLYTYTGAAYHTDKYNKLPYEDMKDEPLSETVEVDGWVALVEHYFLSAWIPTPADQPEALYTRVVRGSVGDEYIIGMKSTQTTVDPGSAASLNTRFYAGPEDQVELEKLANGLELTVDYGIFTVFSKPIFWLMTKIQVVIGNWGWTIIFLTLLIKLALFPLSAASYRSMAKMKAVAPKMQLLKERYADDKQGLQKEMMEMYKKEKINPLGGCLPILVQIPIFISLYWVLLGSVELRQAPWMLWIQDLSIMDPYFVLPVLMGITMYVQQKLNPPPADPLQAKLMMALPFVFTIFFAFFPAGLVLYWFVNNLLSIIQQAYINKQMSV